MSALADLLEDFAPGAARTPGQPPAPLGEGELEALRLEVFETGYKAGWEDAIKAQSEDRSRLSSAFAQHLQDLSFTYHEAYGQVMSAVTPLLAEITGAVLPRIARASLAPQIAAELEALAREIGTLRVTLAVAPARIEAVAPLLQQDFGFPIDLQPDETLSEDQADIRFAETERQIDLGALVASVTEAVEGFTHDNRRKIAHG
jgi:flagellar assembly protein FliH